jgi:multidrug resistance protein
MSTKSLIIFTVLVDIIGIGVIIPVLPFYVQSFGGSAVTLTLLLAVFSLCSFISSPILGVLSDRYGRRPILLASIASTALGWIIFAVAGNFFFLFLGRIIDGLAAGNISTAQACLSDIAKTDKERTSNLGLIGAMFGIGLIIGPLLGGVLGSMSHRTPFYFTGLLALVNFALAYWRLPETHPVSSRDNVVSQGFDRRHLNPFSPIVFGLRHRKLRPILIAWTLFGIAIAAQQSIFILYLHTVFGLTEYVSGFVFAGIGIVLSVNQGLFLKRFWLKRFPEPYLILLLLAVLGFSFVGLSSDIVVVFSITLLVHTVAQSVLRVVITSQAVAKAPSRRGEVLGILSAFTALSMVAGPLFAGALFESHPGAPFLVSAVIVFIAYMVVYVSRDGLTHRQLPLDVPAQELV